MDCASRAPVEDQVHGLAGLMSLLRSHSSEVAFSSFSQTFVACATWVLTHAVASLIEVTNCWTAVLLASSQDLLKAMRCGCCGSLSKVTSGLGALEGWWPTVSTTASMAPLLSAANLALPPEITTKWTSFTGMPRAGRAEFHQ